MVVATATHPVSVAGGPRSSRPGGVRLREARPLTSCRWQGRIFAGTGDSVGLMLANVTLPPEAPNVQRVVEIAESGSRLAAQHE